MAKMNKHFKEELEYRLSIAKDSLEDNPESLSTITAIETYLRGETLYTGYTPYLVDEIREIIDINWNCDNKESKVIFRHAHISLLELGELEVYDPKDVFSRKPKLITINKIQYIAG